MRPFLVGVAIGLVAILLFLLVLGLRARLDPNAACRSHGAVAHVNQSGRRVTGVLCRDGWFVRAPA